MIAFLPGCSLLAILVSGFFAASAVAQTPEPRSSAALKAAIVYNIIRFVEFESYSPSVTLCVRADESVAPELYRFNGRDVASGRLEVRLIRRNSESSECRVMYVGRAATYSQIMNTPGSTMVIGEGADILDRGATVGLVSFGRQIGFEVDLKAGTRAGATFSSRLLRLARNVKG